VTCILNGAAGSKRAIKTRERLADLFAGHGVESTVLLARDGRELTALARRAVEERGGTVVAAGGDGTMNAVASALVGTESPMGVLPVGTLNHFAKDLKIPLELERAVATTLTGRVVRIDVGEVNGHLFLNNSSLGIYPWIVRERETEQRKGYGKWLAFGRAFFSVLKRYSLLQVQLRIEGSGKAEVATPFVFVGNNRYESQGLNIGQRSALDEGRLWVCRAPPASRGRLLLLTAKHAFGSGRAPEFEVFDAEEVSVGTRTPQLAVATDGEVVLLRPPLQYRIRRGALGVIVPAEADATDRN
jgi:diacylglycerol kinase family enzyme